MLNKEHGRDLNLVGLVCSTRRALNEIVKRIRRKHEHSQPGAARLGTVRMRPGRREKAEAHTPRVEPAVPSMGSMAAVVDVIAGPESSKNIPEHAATSPSPRLV
jgi:hypothetical protein